jgi:anti-anti-sigma factor
MAERPEKAQLDIAVVDGLITVSGEVDVSTTPLLRQWLASPRDPFHLDLRGVTFVDSAGLHELLRARRTNPTMRVLVSPALARLLEVTGLTGYLGDGPDNASGGSTIPSPRHE